MTVSRLLALAAVLLWAAPANAQLTLSQTAIGVTSADGSGGSLSLRASIGEPIVGTVSDGSLDLCQGIGCVSAEAPQDYIVTNPIANDYFAHGDPTNIRWTTAPGTPAGNVRISLVCAGQAPYVVSASRANDGAKGFLMPAAVGVHGGPADPDGGCRAEIALADDPSYAGTSDLFVVQDDADAVAVTEPSRFDRYGLQGRFHWRWDPADIPGDSRVRLSLICEGRDREFVRFPSTGNDGNQGLELLPDFGAYANCHAQVAAVDDLTVYGRGQSFEILDEPLPAVEVTAPVAGTVWPAGTTQTVRWETVSTDADINMYVFLDNLAVGASPRRTRLAITPNDGSFVWSIPASQPAGSEYRMRIAGYAQDGSLIRDIAFPFTITSAAPLAKRTDGAMPDEVLADGASIPLERGWTRVEAPTATDAAAWLAPLVSDAGRVVARDGAGRLLSVTDAGAAGDLGALAAGDAIDVWVDADARLGDAPAARATDRGVATPRVAFADGALETSAALWTVTAPSLADGDEIAVLRGDVVVGRGVVSGGAADVVVLSTSDAPSSRTADGALEAPTLAQRDAHSSASGVTRRDAGAAPFAPAMDDPRLVNHADATPLTLRAWPVGTDAPLDLAVAATTTRFGASRADDAPLAFAPGDALALTLGGESVAKTGGAPAAGTDAALSPTADVPDVLTIDAVAPNPVRRSASVRIGLPETASLVAHVYDVRGRQVASLASGDERSAGWHTLEVSADRLAAGVYVVRIETGAEVAVRRFTVIR